MPKGKEENEVERQRFTVIILRKSDPKLRKNCSYLFITICEVAGQTEECAFNCQPM